MAADALTIALVYPELLGTYGDRGNLLALVHRGRARDLPVRVLEVAPGDPVPGEADLYLLGGGEDSSLLLAWELLREQPVLTSALENGTPCLAVCAGFQLLSEQFAGPDGSVRAGMGLLDVRCGRLAGERAVGEVVADAVGLPIGRLSGYENHQGDAALGADATPLGRVTAGTGNGHDSHEGAVQHGVVATYLHGPVLARNPALADHLLSATTGATLEPLEHAAVERLRHERFAAATAAR
ncbi:MAG TPA: glutamine amidotransferase [Nocardioidaceae bacterium]|nr:glutamine amidotransferase [Nocardioidaceae bacterium]